MTALLAFLFGVGLLLLWKLFTSLPRDPDDDSEW